MAMRWSFYATSAHKKMTGNKSKDVDSWIKKLVETLITEEIPNGGWNYANRRQQASFTTAPIVQSLLLAQSQGEKVPPEIFQRSQGTGKEPLR